MKQQDLKIQKAALTFAAKFGFLTRDIFFEFLCKRMKTQQYANWRGLISNSLFHESKRDPNTLHLTSKGAALAGPSPVKRRFHLYIYHDQFVARVLYNLLATGLVRNAWTEAELRETPSDALSILGGRNLEKIPDLVVDLNGQDRQIRLAVEIESSRKSKLRYDQIALSYSRMSRVDLMLFLCEDAGLEYQISKAFSGSLFRTSGKIPAVGLLDDFKSGGLESSVRFDTKSFALRDFLSRILKVEVAAPEKAPNQLRNAVRREIEISKRAA